MDWQIHGRIRTDDPRLTKRSMSYLRHLPFYKIVRQLTKRLSELHQQAGDRTRTGGLRVISPTFLPLRSIPLLRHSHYHDFIKQRDQNTIKLNKQIFLQELKKPNTRSQKMEANIMKEIKQFINYSKKAEIMANNGQNDASIINAYFGS